MSDQQLDAAISLLGELHLSRGGETVSLPASRKTRALLVWLALHDRPQRRETLSDLLWQGTDDPRGGLRWSLAKLRPLLGDSLQAGRDTVQLIIERDLDELLRLQPDFAKADRSRLEAIDSALDAGYLPGIDCGENPNFELWLESERASLRRLHGELLAGLADLHRDDPERAIHYSRKRLGLEPGDVSANLSLLELLLAREGEESARRAMEQCRARLRHAGIDDEPLLRGWRQMSAVQVEAPAGPVPGPAPVAVADAQLERQELPLPGKPSLAVLDFQQMGGDPSDVLGMGLTADLVSRLSRVGGLFVIARASSTRFSPQEHDFPDIGQLLGVRYLIHGSLQSLGARLRVSVELVEAATASAVWAEQFDYARDDLFLLQDELANAIVSAIEPEIERAEYERARLLPTNNLDAWGNYHLALWHNFRFTARDTELAHNYLQRALQLDPNFSRAHAAMSLMHFSRAFLDASENADTDIALALASAERSVDLDGRDAMGHWSLGRAHFLRRQHDLALLSLERALQSNPNYAQGHYAMGFIGTHAGIANALPELDIARRLSPYDPLLFAMESSRALSLATQEKYHDAAHWAVRATVEPNAHFHIFAIAAACLELDGRHDEAGRYARLALEKHPGYTREIFFRSFPYKQAHHRQRIFEALGRAGLI